MSQNSSSNFFREKSPNSCDTQWNFASTASISSGNLNDNTSHIQLNKSVYILGILLILLTIYIIYILYI